MLPTTINSLNDDEMTLTDTGTRNGRIFRWSLVISLGGFLFGFDTAVISGVEKIIQQLFNLSPFRHGLVISSALFGTMAGSLISGRLSDKFGRRPVLLAIAVLFAVSAFGSGLANNVWSFVLYRFLGGIAVGGSSVSAPMYISEISPKKIRGRMTAMFQFNVILGILIAYLSNFMIEKLVSHEAWRWMLAIGGVPAVIYFILLFLVPESPRYLLMQGKIEKAGAVLRRIETKNIEYKLHEISATVAGGSEVFFSRKFLKPITIAFLVAMFNQFSGINAILYYAPRIFELAGFSSSQALLQPILIGLTNGLFTMLGLMIIDRVGRKKLLIVGSIGMAGCLALIAYSFYVHSFESYALLFYLIGYILFFAFSTGAVIWVLISEIFPNSVRARGQSLGSFTHWFFASLVTFLFPVIVGDYRYGPGHAFLFFSIMMIVQAFTVWKYFPETKGKSLEEIGASIVDDGARNR